MSNTYEYNKKHQANIKEQLGVSHATAGCRLRRRVFLQLIQQSGRDNCFRCGQKLTDSEDFSIDHKIPWLNDPNAIDLFHDLDNIAFSHDSCNIRAARKTHQKHFTSEEKRIARNSYTKSYRERCLACCDNCRELMRGRHGKVRKDYPCLKTVPDEVAA